MENQFVILYLNKENKMENQTETKFEEIKQVISDNPIIIEHEPQENNNYEFEDIAKNIFKSIKRNHLLRNIINIIFCFISILSIVITIYFFNMQFKLNKRYMATNYDNKIKMLLVESKLNLVQKNFELELDMLNKLLEIDLRKTIELKNDLEILSNYLNKKGKKHVSRR